MLIQKIQFWGRKMHDTAHSPFCVEMWNVEMYINESCLSEYVQHCLTMKNNGISYFYKDTKLNLFLPSKPFKYIIKRNWSVVPLYIFIN